MYYNLQSSTECQHFTLCLNLVCSFIIPILNWQHQKVQSISMTPPPYFYDPFFPQLTQREHLQHNFLLLHLFISQRLFILFTVCLQILNWTFLCILLQGICKNCLTEKNIKTATQFEVTNNYILNSSDAYWIAYYTILKCMSVIPTSKQSKD